MKMMNKPVTTASARLRVVPGMSSIIMMVMAMIVAGCLAGCRVGPRDFYNENDRLREENLKLQREVDTLNEQLNLRLGELSSLRQQVDRAGEPIPGAQRPVLSLLRFDRYSGPLDDSGDGCDDRIRIYLRTLDQRGRFMPVAGRAHVQAVILRENQPPVQLAEQTFDPKQFDAAYRTGLMGTHYTLELPVPEDHPAFHDESLVQVTVKVTFTEADTGVRQEAQLPITLRRLREP